MRRSSRLPADLTPIAFSRLLADRRSAPDFLDLAQSNPRRCGFEFPGDDWREALSAPQVMDYDADPQGGRAAREAIAAHHAHHAEGVHPEDILLTASTSEAYSWLFKLLCDPGDEVLVPSPSYPLFEHLAALEGLRAVHAAAYFHERWRLDLEAMESACGPRTKAIIVVNPNNPTGQFLSRGEWRGLTDLCRQRELALVVDEVFADFSLEPREDAQCSALLDEAPPCPVFVLSGLSKVALLPQVKLGWILLRGAAKGYRESLAFLADQYLSVSASAQTTAPAALRLAPAWRAQVRERALENLHRLDSELAAFPHLSRLPVEGGWSVLLRRPALESDEACAMRLLEETSVLVHPGHYFDLPTEGYLCLSLLTPPGEFHEGLARILPRLPLD